MTFMGKIYKQNNLKNLFNYEVNAERAKIIKFNFFKDKPTILNQYRYGSYFH
jgi:hypothetical protein